MPEPARARGFVSRARPDDKPGDLGGIESFVIFEGSVRSAANAADDVTEFLGDDQAAESLMGQSVVRQIMRVEEVSERTVPHIMKQAGEAQTRFDVSRTGAVRMGLFQRVVEMAAHPASQVHRSDYVRKPRMLG